VNHIRIVVLTLFACFVSAAFCQQPAGSPLNNWSEFLTADMQRNNPYEDVLNVDNVRYLEKKWHASLGVDSMSSAAVVNGIVYVQADGGGDGSAFFALNASTGAAVWVADTAGGSYCSPAVAEGVVYYGDGYGNFNARNASTGAALWFLQVGNYVVSSPTVANGVVYVGSDTGGLYALDASNGNQVWYFGADLGGVDSSPAVVDGVVYIVAGSLYALNASTGDELWYYAVDGGLSQPAVANGVVYAGSGDNNVYAVNASTGALLWSYTTGGAVTSSPAVANGVVYIGSDDQNLYALNASTGALLWSFATGGGPSSPAVANGVVYIGAGTPGFINDNEGQNLYALNASTGALLWSFKPKTKGQAGGNSPAVANGMVFYTDSNHALAAFGLGPEDTTRDPSVKVSREAAVGSD